MMSMRMGSDKALAIPENLANIQPNAPVHGAASSSSHPSTDNSPMPSPVVATNQQRIPVDTQPLVQSPAQSLKAKPEHSPHQHRKVQISEKVNEEIEYDDDVLHYDDDSDVLGVSFNSSADALQGR